MCCVDPDDGVAVVEGVLDDFGGAAATGGGFAVPDGDKDVAAVDGQAADGFVSGGAGGKGARQFNDFGGTSK